MSYISKGWMEANYGLDPFVVSILDVPGHQNDPIFGSMVDSLKPIIGNYGPRFQDLARLVAEVSSGNPAVALFLFKALGLVVLIAIAKVLEQFPFSERESVRHLLLLNPLILANFVGAAHNDVYSALPMLVCAALTIRRRFLWAGLCLGFATSLKISSILIAPAVCLSLAVGPTESKTMLRGWMALGVGSLVGLLVGFAGNTESLTIFVDYANNEALLRSTIHALLAPSLAELNAGQPVSTLLFGRIVFFLIAGWRLFRNLRSTEVNRESFIVGGAFETIILAQIFAMQMMNEWYLLWAFVFALAWNQRASREWLFELTLVYMPAAIWAVLAESRTIWIAQAVIVTALALSAIRYFRGNQAPSSSSQSAPVVT